jgi:hypothetical protein
LNSVTKCDRRLTQSIKRYAIGKFPLERHAIATNLFHICNYLIGNLALVAINDKELRREAGRPAFYI